MLVGAAALPGQAERGEALAVSGQLGAHLRQRRVAEEEQVGIAGRPAPAHAGQRVTDLAWLGMSAQSFDLRRVEKLDGIGM